MQPDHHPDDHELESTGEHDIEPGHVVLVAGASPPSAENWVPDSRVACAADERSAAVPVEAVDAELRHHAGFAQATGVVLACYGLSVAQAQELLLQEAVRRGVDVLELAQAVASDPGSARQFFLTVQPRGTT